MNSEAYKKAIGLLKSASTAKGFTAAVHEEDNYKRIWTRDSALCGLAALAADDKELISSFKHSIETLFRHQHTAGFIPSNVALNEESISYGSVVGRVDNHAWIVISACTFARLQNKKEWLHQYKNGIEKCIHLMHAWEFNGRGLMYVPQSADWADEYHHHGYILYNQLLRLWALRCAAKAFSNQYYLSEAQRIQQAIETYFGKEKAYAVQIERMREKENKPYWIMGFNTSSVYNQFDLQANALALFLNIGTNSEQISVVNYVRDLVQEHQSFLPSFYPVIEENDNAMQDLKNNYAFRFRNHPHEFHNGGLWPVWNGFAALCISKYDAALAQNISETIVAACAKKDWDFNECYHGKTGEPIGVSQCAWSAAGMVLSSHPQFANQLML